MASSFSISTMSLGQNLHTKARFPKVTIQIWHESVCSSVTTLLIGGLVIFGGNSHWNSTQIPRCKAGTDCLRSLACLLDVWRGESAISWKWWMCDAPIVFEFVALLYRNCFLKDSQHVRCSEQCESVPSVGPQSGCSIGWIPNFTNESQTAMTCNLSISCHSCNSNLQKMQTGIWMTNWPAILEAWPRWGEYDILEAVHNQTYATTTLHTRSNCVPWPTFFFGCRNVKAAVDAC